jgi:hypothetical protein
VAFRPSAALEIHPDIVFLYIENGIAHNCISDLLRLLEEIKKDSDKCRNGQVDIISLFLYISKVKGNCQNISR